MVANVCLNCDGQVRVCPHTRFIWHALLTMGSRPVKPKADKDFAGYLSQEIIRPVQN